MKKRAHRILAIGPGTREMGVAILEGGELVYHGVEVFKNRCSPHDILADARRKVLRLTADFRPATVVVEKTFFAKNRGLAPLNIVADEAVAIARQKRLRVLQFAPSTVKKAIYGRGHAGKEEVARAVAARFPELKPYLGQQQKWRSRFQTNRFDAVALAVIARRIGSRRLKTVRVP